MNFKKLLMGWVSIFILLIVLISIMGLKFRMYHSDYPVVGYHNWKSEHYLGEARQFERNGFFSGGFFVPQWEYPKLQAGHDFDGYHSDTFPSISIIVAVLFKFFGESLFLARLVGILLSAFTIIYMGLLVKEIFDNEISGIIAALITAIAPGLIFFSHNIQLVNLSLFGAVAGLYYFFRWKKTENNWLLILSTFLITLSVIGKYDFVFTVIPIVFVFPYKKIFKEFYRNWLAFFVCLGLICLVPLWLWYMQTIGVSTGVDIIESQLELGFQYFDWGMVKSYLADNITWYGFLMSIFGFLMALLKWKDYKFLITSWVVLFLSLPIMATKLSTHSYHWFPFMPMMILSITFFSLGISNSISRFLPAKEILKKYGSLILSIFIIIIFMAKPSFAGVQRQFNTQFLGLDIAGDYIKTYGGVNDRIIHPTGQVYGLLWHADKYGSRGMPKDLTEFKFLESKGYNWLFLYQDGFIVLEQEEFKPYIEQNYEPVQAGLINGNLLYLLLKRGGNFSVEELNQEFKDGEVSSAYYEFIDSDDIEMEYISK